MYTGFRKTEDAHIRLGHLLEIPLDFVELSPSNQRRSSHHFSKMEPLDTKYNVDRARRISQLNSFVCIRLVV